MLVMRSCLVLAAFAALFQSQPDKDGTVQQAFKVIIKVLGGCSSPASGCSATGSVLQPLQWGGPQHAGRGQLTAVRGCCRTWVRGRVLRCPASGHQLLTPHPSLTLSPLFALPGCVVLLTVANLIKKVSIKLMSTHFHKEAHFNRMQEALRKVGGWEAPTCVALHWHCTGTALALYCTVLHCTGVAMGRRQLCT